MILRGSGTRVAAVSCVGLALLLFVSGLVSADTHAWTTQADFQSGVLTNVNATLTPGDLLLATNATAFAKYSGNPVLAPSTPGAWDSYQVIPSSVLKIGTTYHLWYWAADGAGPYAIGHATSADGVTWTRDSSNPVLLGGRGASVLYEGGSFKMWYTTDAFPWSISYATSPDGTHWTNYSANPVLAPSNSGWDSYVISTGAVLHNATGYFLWYSATADQMSWQTGLATSSDGINWSKYPGNPIITVPFGGWWDAERVITSWVLPWQGELLMGYAADDTSFTQRIGIATSADGVHWQSAAGPALSLGRSGAWDSGDLSGSAVLSQNGNLTLWYAGTISGSYSVGIATTPGYTPLGTFVSGVFDSGTNGTSWSSLNLTASVNWATYVSVAARAGNTPTPDATWSAWSPDEAMNVSPGLPRSRYVQVRALLGTVDASYTPVLHSVSVIYTPDGTTAPTGVSPSSGAWTANATTIFQWTFQDPNAGDTQLAYELQLAADPSFTPLVYDTGVQNGTNGRAIVPTAADGTFYWRVRTQDNWGTWGPYSSAFILMVDRTAPTVAVNVTSPTLVEGGIRYVTSMSLFTLTASDGPQGIGVGAVAYTIDSAFPTIYTVPFRLNGTDGPHFVRFTAADLLGNVMAPQTMAVTLDDTGPTLSFGITSSGAGYQVVATATDAGSGVSTLYVSVDSGPWDVYNGALTVEASGSHVIEGYAVDRLGNIGATERVTIVIPNVQPYLAGSIGVLGILLGSVLLRTKKGGARVPAFVSFAFGTLGVALGATSAGTGLLGIPPWPSLPLGIDVVLGVGILAALILARRARSGTVPAPPDDNPPPRG